MFTSLALMYLFLRARLGFTRDDDRGMTTETMIITAILAGIALLVVGLIADRIQEKGGEIEDDIQNAMVLLQ